MCFMGYDSFLSSPILVQYLVITYKFLAQFMSIFETQDKLLTVILFIIFSNIIGQFSREWSPTLQVLQKFKSILSL